MASKDRIEGLAEEATEVGQLKRELREEREKSKYLAERVAQTERALDFTRKIDDARSRPPRWIHKPSKAGHTAIPVLLITDQHFDEVVEPAEVLGLNAYNREIASLRLEKAFRGTITVTKELLPGYNWDGIVVAFGGDNFTGEIHAELTQTNVGTNLEALIHYVEPTAAGLGLLADEFGKVHVVGVPGNHDRSGAKPRYKRRVRDSYAWAFYQSIAREFRGDGRVTFDIPDSFQAIVPVYDTRLLLQHGDEFKGGSGISAALSPLMLGEHRMRKQHQSASRYGGEDVAFDLMVVGHFHSRYVMPGFIAGGCLKGFDEYALGKGFDYRPPSQELFVVAPEKGVVFNAEVFVQDRKAEGW